MSEAAAPPAPVSAIAELEPQAGPTTSQPSGPPSTPNDPWLWCLAIPALFGALASIRLTVPAFEFFDETHYIPAAREWLTLITGGAGQYINSEHPPLAKQLMALGIYLFGDNPVGWRAFPLFAGIVTIGASMRALWNASQDRFATIAFGVLLATGFHVFIHARIAMLDIYMMVFLSLAAWFFAAAIRKPETGRWRLALCGVFIGAAMASKWAAIPLAMLPGLAFFGARLSAGRRRLITSTRGVPVPGISLAEAFVWLGLLPLAVYALAFWPGAWLGDELRPSPVAERGLFGTHMLMLELQTQVLAPHNYQSTWPQWVMNTNGIWYFYAFTDGAQRGVLYVGNPLTMLLGLPALLWCLISGAMQRDWAKVAMVIGYAVSLALWIIAPKPVQFYYHYIMPSFFLLAALAMALSDIYRIERLRVLSVLPIIASAAMFAYFFPVLTAGALEGEYGFVDWAWLPGWR
ncbi:MAG: glycosyltransferase family 39 protein [Pseudomonadota bacterium]